MGGALDTRVDPEVAVWQPSEAQLRFYATFGYLHLPGLLADEIDRIERGFEAVLADPTALRWSTEDDEGPLVGCRALHGHRPRTSLPSILEQHDDLRWLADDPRLWAAATAILGRAERRGSDGNVMSCPTSWHVDFWGSPLAEEHLKVFIYLDRLDHETGALRVMPGSHLPEHPSYAIFRKLTMFPDQTTEHFGMEPSQLPCQTIPNVPGDVVLLNYRTLHASFGGGDRRRYLGVDFRVPAAS